MGEKMEKWVKDFEGMRKWVKEVEEMGEKR